MKTNKERLDHVKKSKEQVKKRAEERHKAHQLQSKSTADGKKSV